MSGRKLAGSAFKALTGCDVIRAMTNALTKHVVPAPRKGFPKNSLELAQRRIAQGHKLPANTSGRIDKDSISKSFVKDNVYYHYTPEVHQTPVVNQMVGSPSKVSGPAWMKFNLAKRGHYEGFKKL